MSVGDQGGVHEEHPFRTPPELRDPARRLRGRLVAPVTIVTAGDEDQRTGITVSSLVVAEGEPPVLYVLLGPTTDAWFVIEETGLFVVHVAEERHRGLADVFAGLRPAPGGPFLGLETTQTPYGPVLEDMPNRAMCTVRDVTEESSYSLLVAASIDTVQLADLDDPLTYFRGQYRLLE